MRAIATLVVFFLIIAAPVKAQTPENLIRLTAAHIGASTHRIFDSSIDNWAKSEGRQPLAILQTLGSVREVSNVDSIVTDGLWLVVGRATHERGTSDWTIIYSQNAQKITRIRLQSFQLETSLPNLQKLPIARGPDTPASLTPCSSLPELCGNVGPEQDTRVVEFLFATTRRKENEKTVRFSGERANSMTFGSARVHVPIDHRMGHIELPASVSFIGISLYDEAEDPAKHFLIKEVRELSEDQWGQVIRTKNAKEALIFVHGFNTSFDESLYRVAQVVWDLQYDGLPVVFSWASRGGVLNYAYDQQSALIARSDFLELIRKLRDDYHISRINVLAHSMGNLLVLDALAQSARAKTPVKLGGELLMAAPDVDADYFPTVAAAARSLAVGMTLYASSADKALRLSKRIAGVARAGDISQGTPLLMQDMDSIDATSVGDDILGLNHSAFASSRSLMNDIGILLSNERRVPPHARLREIRKVPEGAVQASYWRFSQ